jgi:hypothetical protein
MTFLGAHHILNPRRKILTLALEEIPQAAVPKCKSYLNIELRRHSSWNNRMYQDR